MSGDLITRLGQMWCESCRKWEDTPPDDCPYCGAPLVEVGEEVDPTLWCDRCGARKHSQCTCGPIAENE